MKSYRIKPSRSLRGELEVPGDKSISHRSIIFAALAEGQSRVTGLSRGLDNVATVNAFRAMGVPIEVAGSRAMIDGVGLHGLRMPPGDIDCGNSGTGMRLIAGVLAAQQFGCRLVGDASLSGRPMSRIIDPLRARGAHIGGVSREGSDKLYPPLSVAPLVEGERLAGLEYEMSVASAQIKSCLLLSGLYASGPTVLKEPVVSRDHTERMMVSLGIPIETVGSMVALDPQRDGWARRWNGFDWSVPGDPSSAAFLIAAALVAPDSEITVDRVGINPTRTGFFDALRLMGANVEVAPSGSGAGDEPMARVETRHGPVRGTCVGGEMLVRMIDEVPILCAVAAVSQGTTEIRDAEELRVKESDRIAAMGKVLAAFGVPHEELPDGLRIQGGANLRGADVHSLGDHRIAMSAAILALAADESSVIRDVECVETSFPGFARTLRTLGAHIEESS